MPDTPIDKLTIEINAESKKANDSIDELCKKIEMLSSALGSMNGIKAKGIDDFSKKMENLPKLFETLSEKYKDLGKGFVLKGSTSYIQKQIDNLSNALERAKLKKNELETSGNIEGKMYEYAVRDVIKYENQIESLKNQLQSLSNLQSDVDIKINFLDDTKTLQDFEEQLRNFDNIIYSGGAETEAGITFPTRGLEMTLEQLRNMYPEAKELIASYESEMQMLKEITSNMSRTGDVAVPIEAFMEQFKNKISTSSGKLAEFGNLLKQLEVPEIREENLEKLKFAIEKAETKLDELRTKLANGLTIGTITESVDDSGYTRLQEQIALTEKKLEELKKKKEDVERSSGSGGLGKFKSALSEIANASKKAGSAISKLGSGTKWIVSKLANFRKFLSGIGKPVQTMNASLTGGLKTVLKYAFSIRTLFAAVNKLKSAFKDGMNNLVQYSSETNASVSSMTSSLTQLKNALATAFKPIINVVAPYITTLIQHLTAGANALAQFFSALTGSKTWTKATYNTQNYADSLDNASEYVKKLKNELYGFDEITKQSDTDSSLSGSGSGVAAGDMFTEETVNNQFADFAQMVKDAWENADFTEVGTTIANKLKTALGKIDWESVYSVAGNFGTGLATFLNGLFSADKKGNTVFGSLGTTIAGALNTVVYSVFSFSKKFKWADFGQALKDGIQKFINTADLATAGYTVGNLVKGIATSVYTAVSDVNTWKSLGTKIGEGINGFFNSMGTKDGKTGLTGWETLGKTISSTISGITKSMTIALKTVEWGKVGQAIADFISAIDWTEIVLDMSDLAYEIYKSLIEALMYVPFTKLSSIIAKLVFGKEITQEDWDNAYENGKKEEISMTDFLEAYPDLTESDYYNYKFGGISALESVKSPVFGKEKKEARKKDIERLKEDIASGTVAEITTNLKLNPKAQSYINKKIDVLNKNGKTKSVTTEVTNDSEKDAETIQGNTSKSFTKLPGLKTTVKNTTTAKSLHDPLSGYFMRHNLMIGTTNTTSGSTLRNPLATYMKEHPLKTTVNNTTKASTIRKPLADYLKEHSLKTEVNNTTKASTLWNRLTTDWGNPTLGVDVQTTSGSDLFAMVESDWNVSKKTLKLAAEITADSIVVKGGAISEAKADGGLFKNGSWKPITAFAGGGLPGMGQMFVAREAGPELVGTIGGHTAVMNNDQIVSSVAAGVASAVAGVMSQFSGNSSQELHVYVGGKEITDYVIKDVNQRTIATGACPIMT